jgi:hypothetical protein
MSTRIEFLINAIKEVQETNRFLDAKAGVLVALESSLLIVAISSLTDTSRLQLIKNLIGSGNTGYLAFLAVYFVVYAIALVIHILIMLKIIFPTEDPEAHVHLGDFQPRRLFFLHILDQSRKIEPSVPEYFSQLAAMSDDDITKEYAFELLKLSFIRKVKSDGLAFSFRFLGVLIVGIAVFGLLLALGGLM